RNSHFWPGLEVEPTRSYHHVFALSGSYGRSHVKVSKLQETMVFLEKRVARSDERVVSNGMDAFFDKQAIQAEKEWILCLCQRRNHRSSDCVEVSGPICWASCNR